MEIIKWILDNRPGKIEENGDIIDISHDSGEHSTIWKNKETNILHGLENLGEVYTSYDGMDLFSSTFKISSLAKGKSIQGVEIVESIQKLKQYISNMQPIINTDEKIIPFMYQAGIGFYYVGVESGKIYEWDIVEKKVTYIYEELQDIFKEWLEAVS